MLHLLPPYLVLAEHLVEEPHIELASLVVERIVAKIESTAALHERRLPRGDLPRVVQRHALVLADPHNAVVLAVEHLHVWPPKYASRNHNVFRPAPARQI